MPLPILNQIADHSRCLIEASDVAVVVAHPDDETIGCGALLSRLKNVTVVIVTDGAPRNERDGRKLGFPLRVAYAERRAQELKSALGMAGICDRQVIQLGFVDQEVYRSLVLVSRRLASLFRAKALPLS